MAGISRWGWVLFLAVGVAGWSVAALAIQSQANYVPSPPPNTSWYPTLEGSKFSRKRWFQFVRKSHKDFEARNPRIVMLGDSITHFTLAFNRDLWNEFYGPGTTLNLGIPGDRTQQALWRLYRYPLTPLDPDVVVILLGVNNLREDKPPEAAAGVAQVVKQVQRQLPETNILLLALLPVGSDLPGISRRARATNRLLAAWAAERDVTFVDLKDHFLKPDGTIRRNLYIDEVHLSREGMRIWAEALKPALERLLTAPDTVFVSDRSETLSGDP